VKSTGGKCQGAEELQDLRGKFLGRVDTTEPPEEGGKGPGTSLFSIRVKERGVKTVKREASMGGAAIT